MMRQQEFVDAVLDPQRPAPQGLSGPGGRPAGNRFDVYRNNVAVSLTEALEAGFPVVRKLVGDAWFRAMAGIFLRAHPPRSPLLMFYGDAMPEFLTGFPPAQRLPYLPDVARLELALRRAYHAADIAPIDPAALAQVPADRLDQVSFGLAPAVAVIRSGFPVHGIWQANTAPDAPKPTRGPEAVLVTRPQLDVRADAISHAEASFITRLADGMPLGTASERATTEGQFDLAAALSRLLGTNAITSIKESQTR